MSGVIQITGARIREEAWPLVLVEIFGTPTRETLGEVMRRYEELLGRHEPHAVVFDLTATRGIPEPRVHRDMLRWAREIRGDVRRQCVASGIAMTSAPIRAAVKSIHWLLPPPAPERWFATREEALAWTASALETRGRVDREAAARRIATLMYDESADSSELAASEEAAG